MASQAKSAVLSYFNRKMKEAVIRAEAAKRAYSEGNDEAIFWYSHSLGSFQRARNFYFRALNNR